MPDDGGGRRVAGKLTFPRMEGEKPSKGSTQEAADKLKALLAPSGYTTALWDKRTIVILKRSASAPTAVAELYLDDETGLFELVFEDPNSIPEIVQAVETLNRR